MSSTSSEDRFASTPAWREAGLRYHSRGFFLRTRFGRRVGKISLDAGLGCPNRDGTLGAGGCIFCDPASFSPSRRYREALSTPTTDIAAQLEEGIRRIQARQKIDRFVAYFQPGTNTYGPLERLARLYEKPLVHPAVVGLAIGTRPDCLGNDVLDLLADLSRRTWLSLELGLQTIHDASLRWLGRGHNYAQFLDAVQRGRQRGLEIGVHLILGLPGESREDVRATAREMARLGVASVKLHNLHVVRGTRLAQLWGEGQLRLPDRAEYISLAIDFLERLPPECVVDRLSGDAPPEYLIEPAWCQDKSAVRAAIEAELARRDTWQGKET